MQRIRDVMSAPPLVLEKTASVLDAAKAMAEANTGSVLVVDRDEALCGLVTDRDIVTRAVATARKLSATMLAEMCTEEVASVSPSDTVMDALDLMRAHAVRRLPVVRDGKPVGIVSLGDVAAASAGVVAEKLQTTIAAISEASPNDPPTETRPKVTASLRDLWDVPPMPPADAEDESARGRSIGIGKRRTVEPPAAR